MWWFGYRVFLSLYPCRIEEDRLPTDRVKMKVIRRYLKNSRATRLDWLAFVQCGTSKYPRVHKYWKRRRNRGHSLETLYKRNPAAVDKILIHCQYFLLFFPFRQLNVLRQRGKKERVDKKKCRPTDKAYINYTAMPLFLFRYIYMLDIISLY